MSTAAALRATRDIWYSNHFVTLPYPEPVPGIEQQTIVVTGSNGGLGYEASKHLLRIGVGKLIMAVRDTQKGEDARLSLLEATKRHPEAVEVWELDLTKYESVKQFSTRAVQSLPRLDAVLANAAVCTSKFALDEGVERSITVNVISQCLLLLLLLPKLREAPSGGRFSLVSSKVHYMVDPKQIERPGSSGQSGTTMMEHLSNPKHADMGNRYFLSKLLALYATRAIAEAMTASDKKLVVLNAPNPSYCRSNLERETSGLGLKIRYAITGARSPDMGSRALVHGVLAGEETHGQFLNDCHVEAPGPTVTSKEGVSLQNSFFQELLQKLEAISPGVTANI